MIDRSRQSELELRKANVVRMPTPLLTEVEVAELLKVKRQTLQAWRLRGGGPKFTKLGTLVRYRAEEIDEWLQGQARVSTSDAGQ